MRPLMERLFMLSHPGASRLRVSMTPGSSLSKPAKSRPLRAMSSIVVARDQPGPRAVRGLHLHRLGLHGDGLRQAADVERDRAQRHAFRRAEDDALLLVGLESLHGHGQVERARQQVGKDEARRRVRSRFRASGRCRRS